MRGGSVGRAVAVASVVALAGCAGFPDPAGLPGRYRSTNAPASLELGRERWTLTNGELVKSGLYDTSGNRIGFLLTEVNTPAFERYCRDRADTYEWRFVEGRLVLRPVGEVCDPVAQSVMTSGPWQPEGAG